MNKVKSFLYFLKSARWTVLFILMWIYAISFFFQYELSLQISFRDVSVVSRLAQLTLPIALILIIYSVFNVLINPDTKEIIFSLDRHSKLWYLPLSLLLYMLIGTPLFVWYSHRFDAWLGLVVSLFLLAFLYGSIFCLLVFVVRHALLSVLIVLGLHLALFLILPFTSLRLDMSLVASESSDLFAFGSLALSAVFLLIAYLRERRFFE